jgi:predicted PurR-regulated permease PerM
MNIVDIHTVVKLFMKIVAPVIMSISLMMILSITTYSGYGQMVANTTTTNTTNITDTTATATADSNNQINQNMSQPPQEEIILAEQQIPSQANQTDSIIESSDSLMNERLLNYTNDAILALNDDNETAIQENLVQIQNTLIKAIGKPVVIVPAPAFDIDSE